MLMALSGAVALLAVACGSGDNGSATASPAGENNNSSAANENAAPDLALQTFNHGEFTLEEHRGQPVVINFWFPSCPPCRAEMPDLQETYEKHKDEGVVFLGVQLLGLDTAEDGREFINDMGITYPAGPDESDIFQSYNVNGFPTTVFLNSEHEIVRKWSGIVDIDRLEEFIADAKA